MKGWLRGLGLTALAAGLAAGCGQSAATPSAPLAKPPAATAPAPAAPQKATLVLDWYPNSDHAGIYAAQTQGFTKQAGLDLTIQVPSDPSAALKEVAAGKAEFAVNYEPQVLLSRAQGIPVVAIAAIVQRPLNSIVALQSSGITHPGQLAGKKIGTDGLPGNAAVLQTVLQADHVDPAKVEQVNVGFDVVPALLSHKVDAITGAYWNWEAVQIQLKGEPVNVMHLDQWGVPNYDELVFMTSEKLLQQRPDLVRAFVAAEMKGEQYAIDHPDVAEQALLAANKDLEKPLVEQSLKLLAPVWKADAPRLGYQDPKQWQSYEQWMRSKSLLKQDVDVSQAMTNSDLPQS